MRAISLWQPWAILCCLQHPEDPAKSIKGFETRGWSTKYTGPLLIHAAKRNTREQKDAFGWPLINQAITKAGFDSPGDLAYGAIIGQVDLVHCHPTEPIREIADKYALAMGDYNDRRFAWEIENPVLFPEPISYKGQQGFFDVPESVLCIPGKHTHILDLTDCKQKDLPSFMKEGDPREVPIISTGMAGLFEMHQISMDNDVYSRWREAWIKNMAKMQGAPTGLVQKRVSEVEIPVRESGLPAGARIVPIELWEEWQSAKNQ